MRGLTVNAEMYYKGGNRYANTGHLWTTGYQPRPLSPTMIGSVMNKAILYYFYPSNKLTLSRLGSLKGSMAYFFVEKGDRLLVSPQSY